MLNPHGTAGGYVEDPGREYYSSSVWAPVTLTAKGMSLVKSARPVELNTVFTFLVSKRLNTFRNADKV